jgi:hypothetical protein
MINKPYFRIYKQIPDIDTGDLDYIEFTTYRDFIYRSSSTVNNEPIEGGDYISITKWNNSSLISINVVFDPYVNPFSETAINDATILRQALDKKLKAWKNSQEVLYIPKVKGLDCDYINYIIRDVTIQKTLQNPAQYYQIDLVQIRVIGRYIDQYDISNYGNDGYAPIIHFGTTSSSKYNTTLF